MEEQPLKWSEAPTAPGERITDKPELPPKGVLMELRADTKTMENEPMLKVGESAGWTIYTDESARIGGTGKYPPPMPMLGTAIGF
ncbi:MAG: hypothetical protein HOC91_02880 [Nitrospinaceae bacterium]|jgi:hypothetical protein|nr:hypothetical protein [Nitrospinaceae bacterium]MBT3434067.1 hypothetical protein [Nitrospinaceae bacterium]MBT3820191.1 hypothetical protein [Nitrospinaceae bacterium]MBT4095083.1 hypothetical protein [Nitrospinaceae bacterium]MBT4429438.1 hypothetical protein [Nitrospinaceae bacterium]